MNLMSPPSIRVGSITGGSPAAPGPYRHQRVEVHPPIKARSPFLAAAHRPAEFDGKFRVLLVSTDSTASVNMPSLVGTLSKDPTMDLQVVATLPSLRYYDQNALDNAVRHAWNLLDDGKGPEWGVRRWTDTDEWEGWTKPGDPILSAELSKWTDLVVVAPCSADMLAKVASGFSDNLALSILRSIPSSTPVILCPAMTSQMHANSFTTKHEKIVRAIGYVVLGPQTGHRPMHSTNGVHGDGGSGTYQLSGYELTAGPGQMTDWRDIVNAIQDMAALHQMRQAQAAAERMGDPSFGPANSGYRPYYMHSPTPAGPFSDHVTFLQATAKAGSAEIALLEAQAVSAARKAIDGDDVNMEASAGEEKGKEKEKAKAKADSPPQPERQPSIPKPFTAFLPGWGESAKPVQESFFWPVQGLPTTRTGPIGLGPRAEALSKTPYQFSSAGHWRHMSETGAPARDDTSVSTVGNFIHPATMMSDECPQMAKERKLDLRMGAVGNMIVPSSMMNDE